MVLEELHELNGVSGWLASPFWHLDTLPPKALQDIVTYKFVAHRWLHGSPNFDVKDNSSRFVNINILMNIWHELMLNPMKIQTSKLPCSRLLNGFWRYSIEKSLLSYRRLRSEFLCILWFTHGLCKRFTHVPKCMDNAIRFVEESRPINLANIELVPLFILVAPTMQMKFPYINSIF